MPRAFGDTTAGGAAAEATRVEIRSRHDPTLSGRESLQALEVLAGAGHAPLSLTQLPARFRHPQDQLTELRDTSAAGGHFRPEVRGLPRGGRRRQRIHWLDRIHRVYPTGSTGSNGSTGSTGSTGTPTAYSPVV